MPPLRIVCIDSVENKVDPLFFLFPNIGDSIDVEQEDHLKSFLVVCELFVVSCVFDDLEGLVCSLVGVDAVSLRDSELCFLLGFAVELILLVEELSPSVEGDVVLDAGLLEQISNELRILHG